MNNVIGTYTWFQRARTGRLCLVLAGIAALGLSPTIVRADAGTDAKELFERGRAQRVSGNCAGAVSFFRNAFALYPAGLGSLRNLAECEEALGKIASARRTWLELKRALVHNDDLKYAGWAEDAEQAAAVLAPQVATLTIVMENETTTREAVDVTLNGEPFPPSQLGTAIEQDPGRYVIRITGKRGTQREQVVELTAREDRRVSLELVAGDSQRTDGPLHGDVTQRTASWVAMGVGGAGLIGAGVAWLLYQSALDELGRECPKQGSVFACPESQRLAVQSTLDRGNTASTVLNVFAAIGAVGVASGLVLFATAPSRPTTADAALVLSPTGMSAIGSF
ncbi:MAG: hypothetical protein M3O46_03540 [Myxococcota bacterium]|nr:hypothetical protein [Myxococcota bacterium]